MKYNIKKEFGIFRKFTPPVNKLFLYISRCFMPIFSIKMKYSKKLDIKCYKINCSDKKKIKLYLIRPKNVKEALPVIFDIHGGGFIFKSSPHHIDLAKEYALKTRKAVIYPDYRLAYNTTFGTTFSDCLDSYKFILNNADFLKIDTNKIDIIGDSAGGYLALLLMKQIHTLSLAMPHSQLLIYPVVDPTMSTNSMKKYTNTPMWNAKCNVKMWEYYSKGNEVYNPLLDDLSFMPNSYIETTEYDCLRDEGKILYTKLKQSGVNCKIYETTGTMHGYDIKQKAPTTLKSKEIRIKFLLEK